MPWVALFKGFDLRGEKRSVSQKRILTLWSIERIITAITLRANPARISTDARSVNIRKNSVAVVRWVQHHTLLSPNSYIGKSEIVENDETIIYERRSSSCDRSFLIHLAYEFYIFFVPMKIDARHRA